MKNIFQTITNSHQIFLCFKDPLKMVLTLQERIFIVENVLRKGGKYTKEVQELFQEKFGAERLPHRNCVSALSHKFKETGSVQRNWKCSRQTQNWLPKSRYRYSLTEC